MCAHVQLQKHAQRPFVRCELTKYTYIHMHTQTAGLHAGGFVLEYAPDSSLPIVIGATANAEDREFELFMDVSKKRLATTASRKKTK